MIIRNEGRQVVSQKNYYFVGANIDGNDQTDQFVKEGKWVLGWLGEEENTQYKKMRSKLDAMSPGDKIIIKSTYTKKNGLPFENPSGEYVSVMNLKASGTVQRNLNDGHTILVDWDREFKPKEWYFFTGRETIWNVSSSPFEEAKKLIEYVESDNIQDYSWFLSQPDWSKYLKPREEVISSEDLMVFREYLDSFIEVVNNSRGNIGIDKNGKEIENYVVGGSRERAKLSTGLPLGRKFAGTGNRLYRYPYVNNDNWTNLYFDWKPEYFDKPTLFVSIPNKPSKYFSHPLEEGINVTFGKNPNEVFGYEAVSSVDAIDYEELLKAMIKLTNHEKFDESSEEESESMREEYCNPHTKELLIAKNLIFRGAPGTGKTFLAQQIAADLISGGRTATLEELTPEELNQMAFVQFHPSYDYTDFVEGLRPVTDDETGQIGFELCPGVFKEFCTLARKSKKIGGIDNFDEAWEKFFEAVNEVQDKTGDITATYNIKTITYEKDMHLQSYVRGDMEGVWEYGKRGRYYNKEQCRNIYQGKPGVPQGGLDSYRKAIVAHLKEAFGLKDYVPASDSTDAKPYIFIIDEINRGEISKIFGELFFSVDPGYRGPLGAVATQYENLHESSEEKFYIPDNVYIIGTMNDIDRSVDSFDFAMRRRFRFIEITAEQSCDMLMYLGEKEQIARKRLTSLNVAISNVSELNPNYHIGAAYFLKLKDLDEEQLWNDYLKPLLQDYVRGMYEEDKIMDSFYQAYKLVSSDEGDDYETN